MQEYSYVFTFYTPSNKEGVHAMNEYAASLESFMAKVSTPHFFN